jgi:hypothetical protein
MISAVLLVASAMQAQQPRTAPSPVEITAADAIEITPAAVLFGNVVQAESLLVRVRYDRPSGQWAIAGQMASRRDAQASGASEIEVAPGWTLVDPDRDAAGPRPYLRSDRDSARFPVRVTLTVAARAELRRTWALPADEPVPPFTRSLTSWAHAGNYVWIGLRGGLLGEDEEECEGGTGARCDGYAGAIVQFNTRTRAMRFLLPAELSRASPSPMIVAQSHLWIGADTTVIRYRIIPDTGVRPAPFANAPTGTVRELRTDGRTVALLTTAGAAVADEGDTEWRTRWFELDDAADTTSFWLSAAPPPDTVHSDTTSASSYNARRGVRLLMDALRLPLARRAAFRRAASRLPASGYVELFGAYRERSTNPFASTFLIGGAEEEAEALLADSLFMPFLIEAMGAPDQIADDPGGHRTVAISALMRLPNGTGRRIVHATLDTMKDMRRGVAMATQLSRRGDMLATRWLLTRFADREFLARDLAMPAYESSLIFGVPMELRDTAFAPALLELLPDPRFAHHVFGSLTTLATDAPWIWQRLVRRAAVDSSLAGVLLARARYHDALSADREDWAILHVLARRIVRLGQDTVERKRFSLNTSPDVDLVSSAIGYLVRERDGGAIPDLLRLLREGNAWDFAAAAYAMVDLTGIDSAPPLGVTFEAPLRARVERFWAAWSQRTPRPTVVSAAAGAAAVERYRQRIR